MRKMTWAFGILFAAFLPTGVYAQAPMQVSELTPGLMEHLHVGLHGADIGLFAGISLADGQRAQVQQIMLVYKQQAIPVKAQLISAEERLRQILLAPGPLDSATASALEQQVTQLNGRLDEMAFDALLQIRTHLTEAQLSGAEADHLQRMRQAAPQAAEDIPQK